MSVHVCVVYASLYTCVCGVCVHVCTRVWCIHVCTHVCMWYVWYVHVCARVCAEEHQVSCSTMTLPPYSLETGISLNQQLSYLSLVWLTTELPPLPMLGSQAHHRPLLVLYVGTGSQRSLRPLSLHNKPSFPLTEPPHQARQKQLPKTSIKFP